MATRFYLHGSGTPPVSPAYSQDWDTTASAKRRRFVVASGAVGNFSPRPGSNLDVPTPDGSFGWTSGQLALSHQYVSDPLNAGPQLGSFTFAAQCFARELVADDNVKTVCLLRVFSEDGSTEKAVLLSTGHHGAGVELATTSTGRNARLITSGTACESEYQLQLGDRLVFEIGFTDVSGTTPNAEYCVGSSLDTGGSGADATADDDTQTANSPGWLELSDSVTFMRSVAVSTLVVPQVVRKVGSNYLVWPAVSQSVVISAGPMGGGGALQRWYFPSATSPAVTPAYDTGWIYTTEATRLKLLRDRLPDDTDVPTIGVRVGPWTNNATNGGLVAQFTSDPLAAGISFNGAHFKCYCHCREWNGTDEVRTRISIRLVSQDGGTFRTPAIFTLGHAGTTGEIFASIQNQNARNAAFAVSGTLCGNVTSSAGDRLVVELGGGNSGAAQTSPEMSLKLGASVSTAGTGLDATESEGQTVNAPGWIEFDIALPLLSGTPVSRDHFGPHGAVAFVSASRSGGHEAVAPVTVDHSGTHEGTGYVSPASFVGAHEVLGSVVASHAGAHEGTSEGTPVSADHTGAHEGQYVGFFNRRTYALIESKLDGLAEKSDLCYDWDEDYLYTITNNAHIIRRFDRKGTQVGSDITFPTGQDLEGIVYLGKGTGYPGRFVIMEEGDAIAAGPPYNQAKCYFFDMNGSTTTISAGAVTTISCPDITTYESKGVEGVAYDRVRDKFYHCVQTMASGEGGLWETTISGGTATSTLLFRWFDTIVAAGYLSGTASVSSINIDVELKGYEDSIFVLAWDGANVNTGQGYVFEMDRSGSILSVLNIGAVGQAEGVAIDRLTADIYITGEETTPTNWWRWSTRPQPTTDTVLALESTGWRYWYPTADSYADSSNIDYFSTSPPFYDPTFNPDSPPASHPAWNTGQQLIGFGALDWSGGTRTVRTNITDLGSNLHTLYEIRDFTVADKSVISAISLQWYRDDGLSVWLNGTLVGGSNQPVTIAHNASATGAAVGGTDEGALQTPISIDPALLVNGSNRLAIAVWNNGGTSSDLGADVILTLTTGLVVEPVGKRHDGAFEAVIGEGTTPVSSDHVGAHEAVAVASATKSGGHEAIGPVVASPAGAHEAVAYIAASSSGGHEGTGAGSSATHTGGHEVLGEASASVAGGHEVLGAVSATHTGGHEAPAASSSTGHDGGHEALAAVPAASNVGAHEATGYVTTSSSGGQEVITPVEASTPGGHEAVAPVAADVVGAHEVLVAVSQEHVGAHEGTASGAVSADHGGAHEAIGPVTADTTGGLEALGDVAPASATGGHEVLGYAAAENVGVQEALGAASSSTAGGQEATAYAATSHVGAQDLLGVVSSDTSGGNEALGELAAAHICTHEATGYVDASTAGGHEALADVAPADFVGGHEVLGLALASHVGTHEAFAADQVSEFHTGAHEAWAPVTADLDGGHEAIGPVTVDVVGGHEVLVAVAATATGGHESLAFVAADATGVEEALASVSTTVASGGHEVLGSVAASPTGGHEVIGLVESTTSGTHEATVPGQVLAEYNGGHEAIAPVAADLSGGHDAVSPTGAASTTGAHEALVSVVAAVSGALEALAPASASTSGGQESIAPVAAASNVGGHEALVSVVAYAVAAMEVLGTVVSNTDGGQEAWSGATATHSGGHEALVSSGVATTTGGHEGLAFADANHVGGHEVKTIFLPYFSGPHQAWGSIAHGSSGSNVESWKPSPQRGSTAWKVQL